jgi:SpoVK/Ycf46/Vps4 family AAA+-type ATPase
MPIPENRIPAQNVEENTPAMFNAIPPDRIGISFDDIGGMEELKQQARMKIIMPFKNPQLFKKFGKSAGGGILLYGPPGCGKTFFAKAIATECGATFFNVEIDDILDMWMGQSEKNIAALFTAARAQRPCVVFIDEIDALGRSRNRSQHTSITTTVNKFLAELDGLESDNENILILGATNAVWDVDCAFKRPGRFDRVIFVPPPDEASREEIFRLGLVKLPMSDGIDAASLAQQTDKFSGADIQGLLDRAAEKVLEEILESGKERMITGKDIQVVLKLTRPSTLEWLESAKNYVEFANATGQYDELKVYLERSCKKRSIGF